MVELMISHVPGRMPVTWFCPSGRGGFSQNPATLDDPHENDDDRHYKEDVDEAAHRGARDKSQQPKDDENNGNGH